MTAGSEVVVEGRYEKCAAAIVSLVISVGCFLLFTDYWPVGVAVLVSFILGAIAVIADPPRVRGE